MTAEDIWVKRSSGISAFGTPMIVMAAQKSGQQHWIGDYFIFLGGRYPAYLHWPTGINAKGVPEDIAWIDAEYIRIELEQHSAMAVSDHCYGLYEKSGKEGFLTKLEFEKADKIDILRSWLRGEHNESIRKMYEQTRIDTLKSFLKDVVNLTPMVKA